MVLISGHPSLLAWQNWLSLVQLTIGCYGTGYLIYQLDLIRKDPTEYTTSFMAFASCFFVLWVSIMANDIFILTIDSKRNHTYLGCLAAQAIINIFFATVLEVMACIGIKFRLPYWTFPVETMVYAFTRNSFAVAAMGILIFRTITALIQAQNQTGTRMISTGCSTREDDRHNVQILVGHVKRQEVVVKLNLRKKDNSGAWSDDYITEQCSPDKEKKKVWESANGESIVDHYECEKDHMYMVKDTVGLIFSIEARGSLIDEPRASVQIWLFNKAELRNHSHSPNPIDAVRTYLPSWELRPGFHIDSDSRLITRKFITSSIMKDVVLNSEPEYEHVSLYPIFETSVSRYTNQSTPIATAMINLGFKPGFTHSRSKVDLRAPIFIPGEMCDYIEDYRTGTILDVIGSVGGLFALLQAIHVFLFGRPLFWGLTGAKLIAPFGLLGACSSRGFKRRLREQYHKNTTDENEDTIRLDAFLRDFVVDFGPADFHHEERQLRQSTSYLEVPESDDALSATPM
ncbi:unnamed protein product [Rhizoctonia solani]|uniref:Transmembrane protein n=1 Tax=Rhizoctonia solani TaxID=456999 RepID=A0A8H3A8J5_9AGAM|nr:unnamed protein product [Rhizoctonia solani]